jgi:hypothetical protein
LGGLLLSPGGTADHPRLVSPERLAAQRDPLPLAHAGAVRRLVARPRGERRLRAACRARHEQHRRARADRSFGRVRPRLRSGRLDGLPAAPAVAAGGRGARGGGGGRAPPPRPPRRAPPSPLSVTTRSPWRSRGRGPMS